MSWQTVTLILGLVFLTVWPLTMLMCVVWKIENDEKKATDSRQGYSVEQTPDGKPLLRPVE